MAALQDDATVVLDACKTGGYQGGFDYGLAGEVSKIFHNITTIAATESYSASEYGKYQIELINGFNEECDKHRGNTYDNGLFQKSFEHGTASEQAEAARSLVAACGDTIHLRDADDKQLMVLGAAMEGSPISLVIIAGSFGVESLTVMKRVTEANGLTVSPCEPEPCFYAHA